MGLPLFPGETDGTAGGCKPGAPRRQRADAIFWAGAGAGCPGGCGHGSRNIRQVANYNQLQARVLQGMAQGRMGQKTIAGAEGLRADGASPWYGMPADQGAI